MEREFETQELSYDFVVVGGGFSGICCAIEAARCGIRVALVSNRGFIGGNSGAEIRCPVDGADGEHQFNFNARETGLIEEIRLENLHVNPAGNSYRWDAVLMDFIAREKNLTLYLNTVIDRVDVADGSIRWVSGVQYTTESRFRFKAPLFADNTGDGTLGMLAGCRMMTGAEPCDCYGEKLAPEKANDDRILSTLTFFAQDTGAPVAFVPPDNSFDISKTEILQYREIPKEMFQRFIWFYELGAGKDEIKTADEINLEHRKLVYSIWEHIKKHPETYHADNYDFAYIAPHQGKRETRRIRGEYVLTEADMVCQRKFADAAGYGGWAVDIHAPLGFFDTADENSWVYLKGVYTIPLRCAVAKDVENLFLVGRCFSVSRVALGSTRLNATLATVGQTVGLAAALCAERGIGPKELLIQALPELRQRQLSRDQYLPGVKSCDPADKARTARVTASSQREFALREPTHWFSLNAVTAVSLPVTPALCTLSLLLRCTRCETLRYRVYAPDRAENYNPQTLLFSGDAAIQPSETGRWITIPFAGKIREARYVFLELMGSATLELGCSTDRLPTVASVVRRENHLPNVRDYDTMETMAYEWNRLGVPNKLRKYSTASMENVVYTPCFVTEPPMEHYGPEQAVNGYPRPYGRPNLWVSAGVAGEYLELELAEPAHVGRITIAFDSNLNFRIRNVKPYADNAMPEVARDYDVLAETTAGTWTTVRQVRGNFQRFNALDCDLEQATRVRFRFHATNGAPQIGVYQVSVYEKGAYPFCCAPKKEAPALTDGNAPATT